MSSTKRQTKLFVVSLHSFGYTGTISRFSERFRDGQYSLISLLFAVLLYLVSLVLPVLSHL